MVQLPDELPKLDSSVIDLVSYHYDMLMRLRRIRLRDTRTNTFFFLAPVERDGQLILERQER